MGVYFRKRIRVFPGFTINLSKSGMSATVGMRGASVNIGKRGAFLNTGIPGTGIYGRQRILPSGNKEETLPSPSDLSGASEEREIQSYNPELITSETLFGLKETIVKAREVKAELLEESRKANTRKNWALLLNLLCYLLIFGIFVKKPRYYYQAKKANFVESDCEYRNFKLTIDYNFDQAILNDYTTFKNTFIQATSSNRIWDITSEKDVDRVRERSLASSQVRRATVSFSTGSLDFIDSPHDALIFQNNNGGDLYFYPGFILMMNKISKDFGLIDYRHFKLQSKGIHFTETETVPSDAKIEGNTWRYVNKNGSPDRRFKDNYQIPIASYWGVDLQSASGLNESYMFSNAEYGRQLADAIIKYQQTLQSLKWEPMMLEDNQSEPAGEATTNREDSTGAL
jgi:hypothetical protein